MTKLIGNLRLGCQVENTKVIYSMINYRIKRKNKMQIKYFKAFDDDA